MRVHRGKPLPDSCVCCGREAVTVKVKPKRWLVACPDPKCDRGLSYGEDELDAIEKWNSENYKRS